MLTAQIADIVKISLRLRVGQSYEVRGLAVIKYVIVAEWSILLFPINVTSSERSANTYLASCLSCPVKM